MINNKTLVVGFGAIVVLYGSIAISIQVSPWFDWWNNALSDLGHLRNLSAPIFNGGLFFSGFLIMLFSFFWFRFCAPFTSYFLAASGFSLQLVGLFCENYGRLHFYVSVLLFVALFATSLCYMYEIKSPLALPVFLMVPTWWLYFQGNIFNGAAVPEMLSALFVLPWYIEAVFKNGGSQTQKTEF